MCLSVDKKIGPTTRNAHWHGNNAAFVCPMCGHVYIVSARASKKDHASSEEMGKEVMWEECPNPKCGESVSRIWMPDKNSRQKGQGPGEAWIEWPAKKGRGE